MVLAEDRWEANHQSKPPIRVDLTLYPQNPPPPWPVKLGLSLRSQLQGELLGEPGMKSNPWLLLIGGSFVVGVQATFGGNTPSQWDGSMNPGFQFHFARFPGLTLHKSKTIQPNQNQSKPIYHHRNQSNPIETNIT